jgi:MATE family multidrug resistance protein
MGALRGYKITLMPMLMMAAAFWIVGIPLGIWLGYTGWPGQAPLEVYGFWIGLVSGLVLVAIGLTLALRQAANAHLADLR